MFSAFSAPTGSLVVVIANRLGLVLLVCFIRHQRLQLLQQRRQVVPERLPDAEPIYSVVSVYQPVAHPNDACPRNIRVSVLEHAVHAVRSLTQNHDLAEDCPLDRFITHEFRFAQSGGQPLCPFNGLDHVENGSTWIMRHRPPLSNSEWRRGESGWRCAQGSSDPQGPPFVPGATQILPRRGQDP